MVEPTAAHDDAALPSEVAGYLADATRLIEEGETLVVDTLSGIEQAATGIIARGMADLDSVVDEVAGSVDRVIISGGDHLSRAVNSVAKRASDIIADASADLMEQGWSYPYTTHEMASELQMGMGDVVYMRVPELAAVAAGSPLTAPAASPAQPVPPGCNTLALRVCADY